MKKFLLTLVLVLFAAAVVAALMFIPRENGRYTWNPLDYANITKLDYKAEFLEFPGGRGNVIVTERLTFDVNAFSENNPYWELHRPLPEKYDEGLLIRYKVNSVKQVLDNGSMLVYDESPRKYEFEYDYTGGVFSSTLGPGKWYHDREARSSARVLYFYVDGLYREKITFEIEYEIYNIGLPYKDSSIMTLSIYDDSSIVNIQSLNGQVLIPDNVMPQEGNYDIYTYGTNFNSFPYLVSRVMNPGYVTFAFDLTDAHLMFKPHNRNLEFVMIAYGDNRHILSRSWPEHSNSNNDMLESFREDRENYETSIEQFELAKYIVLGVFTLISLIFLISTMRSHLKIRKRNAFHNSAFRIKYFKGIPSGTSEDGELDSNFAAKLVFGKHNIDRNIQDDFAAAILSLTQKGFIELAKIRNDQDWEIENVKINVLNQPKFSPPEESFYATYTTLTPVEKHYFNLIVRHQLGFGGLALPISAFLMRVADDHQYTNSFARGVDNAITHIGIVEKLYSSGMFKRLKEQVQSKAVRHAITGIIVMLLGNLAIYQSRLDLAFGSFFILGGAFIISAVYQGILSTGYTLFTQRGEDEYARWRGLYNYLNSSKLKKDSPGIDFELWEKYFIYATAFGVYDKFIKVLKSKKPNTADSVILDSDSFYLSKNFMTFAHSFMNAVKKASRYYVKDDDDNTDDSEDDSDDDDYNYMQSFSE